jgi:hypothetical protein
MIAAVFSSCASGKPTAKPTTSETESERPGCLQRPKPESTPAWFPKDLPLPTGSYAAADGEQSTTNANAQIFVVNANLNAFIRFAATDWRAAGWITAGGEREADEAEAPFVKGSQRGRFRARNVYCDADKTEVLLVINK